MKKERKTTRGPIREKSRTMDKLVDAVGSLLLKKGYTGINGLSIAKEAKVDSSLIYNYFGSVNKLIEAYIKKTDFWTPDTNEQLQDILENQSKLDQADIIHLLQNQFTAVLSKKERQRILLWEISESNTVLRKVSQDREDLGEKLFELVEGDFQHTHLDLRAILAILISGLYYLSLHAANNGTTFCGVDINEPEGKGRIDGALQQIINLCYEKVN